MCEVILKAAKLLSEYSIEPHNYYEITPIIALDQFAKRPAFCNHQEVSSFL